MLLPSPQIVNNAWEWSYGKHDELEFTRLKYCLGGNYIRPDFLDCNNPAENFPGENCAGESYPGWEFSSWELSWVGIFRVGSAWMGVFLGGNCPGGSFPWWEFSLVGAFRVGIVRRKSPGVSFPSTKNIASVKNIHIFFLKM